MRALSELAAAYADAVCDTYPVAATLLGRHEHDGRLGDFTPATFAAHARVLRSLRDEVAGHLDTADPIAHADAAALDGVLAVRLLDLDDEQQWRRNPDVAIEGALSGCFALLLRDFAPLEQRLASLEQRLDAVPAYITAARACWSDVPALWAETAAESAAAGAEFLRGDLHAAVGDAPGAAAVIGAAKRAADALDDAAANVATLGDPGASWMAGENIVSLRLRHEHHLPDTPAGLEQRGLALVEETLALLHDTDPEWIATVDGLKHDHPTAGELVAAYRLEMERAREYVSTTGLAPMTDAPLDVRATPRFLTHVLPYAAYDQPGLYDRDQTGIFWVTVPEGPGAEERLQGHYRASITVTAVHEGYPGHHQQMTLANRHANLLRILADSTLTIEGWAFYCEHLLWEQGYYGDDHGLRVSQLKDQLWRAARVVLDMRMHCGGATFEEAIDYLVDVARLERDNAEAEVRRYTSTPTYQIGYAIGKAEIIKLRESLRSAEGSQFDLARFHTQLLEFDHMAVPLSAAALRATAGVAT